MFGASIVSHISESSAGDQGTAGRNELMAGQLKSLPSIRLSHGIAAHFQQTRR
jgi:hypothetical protein